MGFSDGRSRFLMARLQMDSLTDKTTPKALKKALEELPKGSGALTATYDMVMQRITDQRPGFQSLAIRALTWITYAERLLCITELRHALAIEPGEPEFDEDNLDDIDQILSVCCGLVIVNRESQIVRFAHYTTQEYFKGPGSKHLPNAHHLIATACLDYLTFDEFGRDTSSAGTASDGDISRQDQEIDRDWNIPNAIPPPSFISSLHNRILEDPEVSNVLKKFIQKYPLLAYAARSWVSHVKFCSDKNLVISALRLLKNDNKLEVAARAYFLPKEEGYVYSYWCHDIEVNNRTPFAIHFAVFLGLEDAVSSLLDESFDINAKSSINSTPSELAILWDQDRIFRLLLQRQDLEVNALDRLGFSNLHYAVNLDREDLVKLLLERKDLDINCRGEGVPTPLMSAAQGGNIAIVKMLLACPNVDVNVQDDSGCSALFLASTHDHDQVVDLLLSAGAEQDSTSKDYAKRLPDELILEVLLACLRTQGSGMPTDKDRYKQTKEDTNETKALPSATKQP